MVSYCNAKLFPVLFNNLEALLSFAHGLSTPPLEPLSPSQSNRLSSRSVAFGIKIRADAEFIHGVNQAADVVAKHLAQHFVFHSCVRSAADMVAEFCFDHAHRGFDIRPLVVVRHEQLPVALEEVEHFLKHAAFVSRG
jgi:hypothetical protein